MQRRRGNLKKTERQSTFAPIGFLIAWSIGLSQYSSNDNARLYAILDLTMCCFIILFVFILPSEFTYLRAVFSIVMFGFGWVWFKDITGLTIFEMVAAGGLVWLEYPILLRVLYFQLWYYIALSVVAFILFVIAVIIIPLWKKRKRSAQVQVESQDTQEGISDEDHLYLNQLVNMPTISTLSGFSSWRNRRQQCTLCGESLTDENRSELDCGHIFHTSCLTSWTSISIDLETTCPVCKEPVLIEFSR